MRTTLNLDDDVLKMAKEYSEERSLPLGKAVSQLVRRGLNAPLPTRSINGIQVFVLPPGSPPVDPELVKRLADEIG
jgi:hypothetical protein